MQLLGALSLAGGLALVAMQIYVLAFFGIAMAYGGVILAFDGSFELAERRSASRREAHWMSKLGAVFDGGAVHQTDRGSFVGRYRAKSVEVSSNNYHYTVRMVVDGGRSAIPWMVVHRWWTWRLQTWSPVLEDRLHQAGVLSMVAERPEFAIRRPFRASAVFSIGHICPRPDHLSDAVEYSVELGHRRWNDVGDAQQLRSQLQLLADLAEINRTVNVGLVADVDPPSGPLGWSHRPRVGTG